MVNLKNVKPLGVREEYIMDLLELYQYKGKDYYYDNILKNDASQIEKKNISKEVLCIANLLNLDITDARKKQLVKSDSEARNKDEQFFMNIKNTLTKFIGFYNEFELDSNEYLNMVKDIYNDVTDIKFRTYKTAGKRLGMLETTRVESLRNEMDSMLQEFNSFVSHGKYELTNLISNLYIDFKKQEIFTNENDFIGIMLIYTLLISQGFTLFKYTSFFELYAKYREQFKDAELTAYLNYEEGYSDTRKLNKVLVDLILEGYDEIDQFIHAYNFDGKNTKEDNIISIIYHLPQEFTKDDIRIKDPLASESTINRALAKLSKQKKVRALGIGRNAKWIRIDRSQQPVDGTHQINLFEIEE